MDVNLIFDFFSLEKMLNVAFRIKNNKKFTAQKQVWLILDLSRRLLISFSGLKYVKLGNE